MGTSTRRHDIVTTLSIHRTSCAFVQGFKLLASDFRLVH